MSEIEGELTPKEIREQNIQFCKENWHEVPGNISKDKLEKLVADIKANNGDVASTSKVDEDIEEKELKVIPTINIAWKDVKWGVMKKGIAYVISWEDYKRIKHLVKRA